MRTQQIRLRPLAILIAILPLLLIGCAKDTQLLDSKTPAPESDKEASFIAKYIKLFGTPDESRSSGTSKNFARKSANATYEYFSFSSARASNGDILEMTGNNTLDMFGSNEGTVGVYPKSAKGGGTFTHTDADGNVLDKGTWNATKLLDFHDYGASPFLLSLDPGFYANWRAGSADILVHLESNEGAEFDGIFRIQCHLPEVDTPNSWVEGIRISIKGGLNFNKTVPGGGTLFWAL